MSQKGDELIPALSDLLLTSFDYCSPVHLSSHSLNGALDSQQQIQGRHGEPRMAVDSLTEQGKGLQVLKKPGLYWGQQFSQEIL